MLHLRKTPPLSQCHSHRWSDVFPSSVVCYFLSSLLPALLAEPACFAYCGSAVTEMGGLHSSVIPYANVTSVSFMEETMGPTHILSLTGFSKRMQEEWLEGALGFPGPLLDKHFNLPSGLSSWILKMEEEMSGIPLPPRGLPPRFLL